MSHDGIGQRIARWLVDHPFLNLAILLLVTGVSLPLAAGLRMERGMEPFYDRTVPEQKINDAVVARFANDAMIFIAYEATDVFSHEALTAIREAGAEIAALQAAPKGSADAVPVVEEVRSLATVRDVIGEELNYRTDPLVADPIPEDAAALQAIRQRAYGNPLIRDSLLPVGAEKGVAGAAIRLARGLDDDQRVFLIERTREALQRRVGQGLDGFHLAGAPLVGIEMAAHQSRDVRRLTPLVVLVMTFVLFLFVRRAAGIALALLTMTLSVLLGLAVLKLVAGTVTTLTTILPTLLMVSSVGAAVHFLTGMAVGLGEGEKEAGRRALSSLLVPAFMCALTTGVGFASVSVSPLPAIQHFGITSSIAFLLTFATSFLICALAVRWKPASFWVSPRSWILSDAFRGTVEGCFRLAERHPRAILAVTAVVTLGFAVGIPRLTPENNTIGYFHESSPLRRATDFAEAHFGGIRPIVVSVQADRPDRFLEPAVLQRVERLHTYLLEDSGADHVVSFVDFVKLMHRGIYSEDPAYHRIPETRDQVSQLVLLNGDPTLDAYVDSNRSWIRVVARTRENSSTKLDATFQRLDAHLAELFPQSEGFTVHATGETRLLVRATQSLLSGQLDSLGLAFLVVFGPIFLLFRSLRSGALSLPSNLIPVVIVLGTMGWFDIPLNVATAMCAPIALGILVDDTIHFISHLREQLSGHGNLPAAVRETVQLKGSTVITATLTFTLGFMLLCLSDYAATRHFGFLISFSLVLGLISELFIMPAVILATRTTLGVKLPPTAASQDARDTEQQPPIAPAA